MATSLSSSIPKEIKSDFMEIRHPSPILSQYIKQYWGIENCVSSGQEYLQRIVPSGLIELSFYLVDKPKVLDSKHDFSENTVLTGQLKGYYEVEITA